MYHVTSLSENYSAINKNFPENLGIEWASFMDKKSTAVIYIELSAVSRENLFGYWASVICGHKIRTTFREGQTNKILWFIEHRQLKLNPYLGWNFRTQMIARKVFTLLEKALVRHSNASMRWSVGWSPSTKNIRPLSSILSKIWWSAVHETKWEQKHKIHPSAVHVDVWTDRRSASEEVWLRQFPKRKIQEFFIVMSLVLKNGVDFLSTNDAHWIPKKKFCGFFVHKWRSLKSQFVDFLSTISR